MKIPCSLFVFFFIQIAILFIIADVTVDTICKDGYMIQMSKHFECACEEGHVLENENTCVKKNQCDTIAQTGSFCDNYAKCSDTPTRENPSKFECKCIQGYSKWKDTCVPTKCLGIDCDKGKCIINSKSPDAPTCSCSIGFVTDVAQNNKCSKEGETKCTLKCKDGTKCKQNGNLYKCVDENPESGGNAGPTPPNNSSSTLSFFSTLYIIFLLALVYII